MHVDVRSRRFRVIAFNCARTCFRGLFSRVSEPRSKPRFSPSQFSRRRRLKGRIFLFFSLGAHSPSTSKNLEIFHGPYDFGPNMLGRQFPFSAKPVFQRATFFPFSCCGRARFSSDFHESAFFSVSGRVFGHFGGRCKMPRFFARHGGVAFPCLNFALRFHLAFHARPDIRYFRGPRFSRARYETLGFRGRDD